MEPIPLLRAIGQRIAPLGDHLVDDRPHPRPVDRADPTPREIDTRRRDQRANVKSVESDAIDMLTDILDDWDNDPRMSGRNEYYNRIVGVTKLLEGS